MIDHEHQLSISRQAKLLGISRGSVYYQRRPSSPADLALMHRMDALHLEYPFAGSRMLRGLLRQEGSIVGRLHVAITDVTPISTTLTHRVRKTLRLQISLSFSWVLCVHATLPYSSRTTPKNS